MIGRAGKKTRHEAQLISHQIVRRRVAGLVADEMRGRRATSRSHLGPRLEDGVLLHMNWPTGKALYFGNDLLGLG